MFYGKALGRKFSSILDKKSTNLEFSMEKKLFLFKIFVHPTNAFKFWNEMGISLKAPDWSLKSYPGADSTEILGR